MKTRHAVKIVKNPKKGRSFDGYMLIGRIKQGRAAKAGLKCTDIIIDYAHIEHIRVTHSSELNALNIDGIDYVQYVIAKYDEIRKAQGNSILLVKKNITKDADTIVLRLMPIKEDYWLVVTAQPRRNLSNNKLLWSKNMELAAKAAERKKRAGK